MTNDKGTNDKVMTKAKAGCGGGWMPCGSADKRDPREGGADRVCAKGRVSPDSEGLGLGGLISPGFRRAEGVGDTEYVFCVMGSRIDEVGSCV